MITFGILVAALINLGTHHLNNSGSWRITVAINIFFAMFLGVGILWCPESPRWLLQQGRSEEARASIARVYGTTEEAQVIIQNEHDDITGVVEQEKSLPPVRWRDIFRVRNKTLYRTCLGMTLQMFQQLTGAN